MTRKELAAYSTDASGVMGRAERVMLPENIEDIQKIVKTSFNLDIVLRGAGTGFAGGAVPNNSIVIDVSKMNKIISFDMKNLRVKVESGMTVKELNERLQKADLEFPIATSNYGAASIGGMIATNAVGKNGMKYGPMKDWVDELEFVNAKGELIRLGKADIGDVCGMEGITGVIVSATLRIIPKVKKSISLFQSDSIDEILNVSRRLKTEREVLSIELFSPSLSLLLGLSSSYNLVIEFNSERGKIKEDKDYEFFSKIKEAAYFKLFSEGYEPPLDPKFFFDKLKEFISFLDSNDIPYFSDIGYGVVYPFFKKNEDLKKEEVINIIKKSNSKLSVFKFGLLRKDFLDSFEKKIIGRIKIRHDPIAKFNKGKVIDFIPESTKEKDSEVGEYIEIKILDKVSQVKPNLGEEKSAEEFLEELEKEAKEIEEIKKNVESDEKDIEIEEKEEYKGDIGQVRITDDLDRSSKMSDAEKDLINRIMTNKIDEKKEKDKNDDKKEDEKKEDKGGSD